MGACIDSVCLNDSKGIDGRGRVCNTKDMKLYRLFVSLSICYFVALFGSLVTFPSITTWYAGLQKPFFNPPNQIFGPVWGLLYTLMGIAFYMVWNKGFDTKKAHLAAKVFALQLALNFLWSYVFFALHLPLLAFFFILGLLASIIWTTVLFWKVSPRAGNLLVPYIAWVSFATLLNGAIVVLN